MAKLRIVLADDHQLLREGVGLLINSQPDMEVVGEASNGAEALQCARNLLPDVLLMDLTMPGLNGLQATSLIKTEIPAIKILALTAHEDETYLRQLINAKASGYLLKRSASNELIQAIRAVAAGELYFDRALAGKALTAHLPVSVAKHGARQIELSDREREVLIMVAWGYSNKEISAKLAVSVRTVETYRSRIGEKLGLHSRTELVRFALREGWLSEDAPVDNKV